MTVSAPGRAKRPQFAGSRAGFVDHAEGWARPVWWGLPGIGAVRCRQARHVSTYFPLACLLVFPTAPT